MNQIFEYDYVLNVGCKCGEGKLVQSDEFVGDDHTLVFCTHCDIRHVAHYTQMDSLYDEEFYNFHDKKNAMLLDSYGKWVYQNEIEDDYDKFIKSLVMIDSISNLSSETMFPNHIEYYTNWKGEFFKIDIANGYALYKYQGKDVSRLIKL